MGTRGVFANLRILHNDERLIAFELPIPNEKMNAIKEALKDQRVLIEYYDAKIKVYSAPQRFPTIIQTLSVF